jgi:Fe-S-cluster-containing hydrogenase component 2
VRRGDKITVQREDHAAPRAGEDVVARVVRLAKEVEWAPLLVPNSCQHCKNPSCMIDCPTGAIGRDARGEVFIREDLCTGCGSCAKACPWDNIQIAPRGKSGAKNVYPEVAVKCDLCAGSPAGPACVASCPVQAIARIDPNEALVELRNAPRTAATVPGGAGAGAGAAAGFLPRKSPAWPWVAGAAAASSGLAFTSISSWTSGILVGVLVVLLVAYAGLKRAPRVLARIPGSSGIARALYVAHLAVGVLAIGGTLAHTHASAPGNIAGTLTLAMALALVTGVFGAVVHVLLPSRLARLERGSVLPEELVARRREIDERIFTQLSGRSELVKTLYGRVLRPYRSARLGLVLLVASGKRLREEEQRVHARLAKLLEGRKSERLDGLDDLVRLVVEHRAIGALRVLTFALRGWLAVHLAATATALVLLVVHVLAVVVRR